MITKWSKKFPTKEGWYWFYGYRFKNSIGEKKKKLCVVNVRKISNGWLYVCNGSFIDKSETGEGVFASAILPDISAI